jgi:hypothetical protein
MGRFKHITLTFTIAEHAQLTKLKEKHGYTWEELVLSLLDS